MVRQMLRDYCRGMPGRGKINEKNGMESGEKVKRKEQRRKVQRRKVHRRKVHRRKVQRDVQRNTYGCTFKKTGASADAPLEKLPINQSRYSNNLTTLLTPPVVRATSVASAAS